MDGCKKDCLKINDKDFNLNDGKFYLRKEIKVDDGVDKDVCFDEEILKV